MLRWSASADDLSVTFRRHRPQHFVSRRLWSTRSSHNRGVRSPYSWFPLGRPSDTIVGMTRSELITSLAARFPQLTSQDATMAVTEIIEAISRALAHGQRIEIRGFGSFALKQRSPRLGRNPKTGEKVAVPAKYTPYFKAGKALRERVDAISAAPSVLRKAA